MSYILDALKRADAERERGRLPGLHTRTAPDLAMPAARASGVAQRGWVIALIALGALGAALGWWWLRATAPAAMPAAAAIALTDQAPAAPASPVPPPPPVQPLAQTTVQPAAPPPTQPPESPGSRALASATTAPVLPILAPPAPPAAPPAPPAPPAPVRAAASPPAQATPDAQRVASQTDNPTTAPPKNASAATGAATVVVQNFADLSPQARARLPAVNVSGATYSKDPALRMLIVNGTVVQEGQEIAPGFTLEAISQRSAVLNHEGLRYRIGY